MALDRVLSGIAQLVERRLRGFLAGCEMPGVLREAMAYTLFAGGKRFRPALSLLACDLLGGRRANVIPAACAIEMIHTYSLIHDDLPAMDNDDFRRGQPTCHKVFGEAVAVLAGDGLLTDAFILIAAKTPVKDLVPALVAEIGTAAGSGGMVGGQVVDIETSLVLQDAAAQDSRSTASGMGILPMILHGRDARATLWRGAKRKNAQETVCSRMHPAVRETASWLVQYIHAHKTAALVRVSVRVGALAARATERQLAKISDFGKELGIAFQIVDDVLDAGSTTEELGKTVGKDEKDMKLTYPLVFGLEQSKRKAALHIDKAKRLLSYLRPPASSPRRSHAAYDALRELCDFTLARRK